VKVGVVNIIKTMDNRVLKFLLISFLLLLVISPFAALAPLVGILLIAGAFWAISVLFGGAPQDSGEI